jgi:CheY-like chemotaxis protein
MEQELEALTENLEQRVLERTAQLRRLASELIQTEQRERRHLAQLLHDHLQQLLVAAQLRVSLVGRQIPDRNQQLLVEQVGNLLGESIGVSRSLSVELSPPVLDLGLSPALEWLARWMKEKYGLQIEVTVDEAASPAEENVRAFLFQAARELLFNVVKHAEVHDARLELHRHGEDEVVLSVVDRGAGFDLPRQMLEPTLTGLGLFSIRERLELLGGRVDIDSVPGQGTCVTLYAPISGSLVDKGDIRTREESRSSGRSHRRDGDITGSETARGEGRIRLLLVDDHPILRQGLATMFETEPDVEVIGEAGDGYEALEMVRRLEPDVVLMDVTMPGMDGIEATRLIKADYPDVDVIGLSMHQEGDVSARMHSAGARAFVTKGGNTDALLRAIRGFRDPRPCYV